MGADTEDQAFQIYCQSKEVLEQGGFNLRKLCTNAQSLQSRIDAIEKSSDRLPQTGDPGLEETYAEATPGRPQSSDSTELKVLGVLWSPPDDCLQFSVSDVMQAALNLNPTKRNVVSVIRNFYDPLGFLAPVILSFKILFQKLCAQKLDWDQPLPRILLEKWRALTEIQGSDTVSIPRSYYRGLDGLPVLSHIPCGFCYASNVAYAAVVYLVLKTSTGNHVRFVVSKTRVAPIQSVTIPRLELLSALLLARLIATVFSILQPIAPALKQKCYSDSQNAVYWIKGVDREWKPFVQNRVNEIRHKTHPDDWNHCPGRTNPAFKGHDYE